MLKKAGNFFGLCIPFRYRFKNTRVPAKPAITGRKSPIIIRFVPTGLIIFDIAVNPEKTVNKSKNVWSLKNELTSLSFELLSKKAKISPIINVVAIERK